MPTPETSRPADESIRDARQRYFEETGVPADGGYDDAWVKLKLGPLPLAFPNTAGRVRAVKLHDVHHVLTGYRPDWIGEAEIGAWELASGCRGFVAAWVLNLAAVVIGLAISPRRVLAAFRRGRRSANLYTLGELRPDLLGRSLVELRAELHIPES
jgi:hypothetical protein